MASDVKVLDVSEIPELARLVKAVTADGAPILLRVGDVDAALLMPAASDHDRDIDRANDEIRAGYQRRRRQGLSFTESTKGIIAPLVPSPPLTPAQEREAFEQGVAEQAMESLGG